MHEKVNEALSTLKKPDLDVLRRLNTPPGNVKVCFDALAILFGTELGWENAKKTLLSNPK